MPTWKRAWCEGNMVIFAVSHSKSPCDGVGGTVKRFTAVKSLWHLFHYQILSVDAMMAYCSSHRTKITFFELSSKELLQQRVKLEQQFQKAVTICSFLFWQRMIWRTCRLLSLWNRGHSFLFSRPSMPKFFCWSLHHSANFLLVSAAPTSLPIVIISYLTLALSSPPSFLLS